MIAVGDDPPAGAADEQARVEADSYCTSNLIQDRGILIPTLCQLSEQARFV